MPIHTLHTLVPLLLLLLLLHFTVMAAAPFTQPWKDRCDCCCYRC
jgi:hypothetical protein